MAKKNTAGGLNRFYLILGAVAIAGVAGVGYVISTGGTTAAEPVEVEGLDDQATLVRLAQGMVQGQDEAEITIYEFGDFQCPACRTWALQVKPLLEAAYFESGKAKMVFYDWPITQIHPNAFLAARASRCAADQDLYWAYHKALFENQTAWSGSGSPASQFKTYAEAVGADGSDFDRCLKSNRHADVITAQIRLGEELGISGTPSVMISKGGGTAQRPARLDFTGISEVIEEMLAN